MLFVGSGKVNFFYDRRVCVVEIDQQLVNYYYALIPKYYNKKRQKYSAHITIIRKWEFDYLEYSDSEAEEKGQNIHNCPLFFLYQGLIYFDKPYFYLKCWSWQIGQIRKSFGLKEFRDGFDCYHITVGNVKNGPN